MLKSSRLVRAVVVLALLAATALFLSRPDATGRSPGTAFPDASVADADRQIERGRYLALAANCATCHTLKSGGFMAGGVAFETPFGTIYSTNITPDPGTGIGNWSAVEFRNAMRYGVRPGGEHLYPVFPYPSFTKITDGDLAALFAYLRNISPIQQAAQANDLSFPFNMRSLMSVWKAMFFNAGAYVPDESRSAQWNRGAYLVEALAHCGACHSPRNLLGAKDDEMRMTGGVYRDRIRTGDTRSWSTPNLTSVQSGLGLWPREAVTAYLKTGRNAFLDSFGPMNEVILNSTRHLSDDDIDAMAVYLKSLPPNGPGSAPPAARPMLGMGKTLYNLHCGTCHLPTGLGDETMAPRLGGGSLVVRASDPASLINVILYGPEPPQPPLSDKWRKPMEEFQYLLDDAEVAALSSFVRNSWDNAGGAVTPGQVAGQR